MYAHSLSALLSTTRHAPSEWWEPTTSTSTTPPWVSLRNVGTANSRQDPKQEDRPLHVPAIGGRWKERARHLHQAGQENEQKNVIIHLF